MHLVLQGVSRKHQVSAAVAGQQADARALQGLGLALVLLAAQGVGANQFAGQVEADDLAVAIGTQQVVLRAPDRIR